MNMPETFNNLNEYCKVEFLYNMHFKDYIYLIYLLTIYNFSLKNRKKYLIQSLNTYITFNIWINDKRYLYLTFNNNTFTMIKEIMK